MCKLARLRWRSSLLAGPIVATFAWCGAYDGQGVLASIVCVQLSCDDERLSTPSIFAEALAGALTTPTGYLRRPVTPACNVRNMRLEDIAELMLRSFRGLLLPLRDLATLNVARMTIDN